METHFLTLETYGRMYERKKMQKIEEEKEKEKTERANGERIGKESENSHSTRKGSTEMREEDEDKGKVTRA